MKKKLTTIENLDSLVDNVTGDDAKALGFILMKLLKEVEEKAPKRVMVAVDGVELNCIFSLTTKIIRREFVEVHYEYRGSELK